MSQRRVHRAGEGGAGGAAAGRPRRAPGPAGRPAPLRRHPPHRRHPRPPLHPGPGHRVGRGDPAGVLAAARRLRGPARLPGPRGRGAGPAGPLRAGPGRPGGAGADRQRRPRRRRPAQLRGRRRPGPEPGGGRLLRQGGVPGPRLGVGPDPRPRTWRSAPPRSAPPPTWPPSWPASACPPGAGSAAPTSTGWWSRAARRSAGPCWSWGPRPPTWPGRTAASGGRCGARRCGWPTPTTPTSAAAWPRPCPRSPPSSRPWPGWAGTACPPTWPRWPTLRLAHPDASLAELGAMLDPPRSKGGVLGRLRRIEALTAPVGGSEE